MRKYKTNTFEQHELATCRGYYKDLRWKKVQQLRDENRHPEANGLVFKIREDYGINI